MITSDLIGKSDPFDNNAEGGFSLITFSCVYLFIFSLFGLFLTVQSCKQKTWTFCCFSDVLCVENREVRWRPTR